MIKNESYEKNTLGLRVVVCIHFAVYKVCSYCAYSVVTPSGMEGVRCSDQHLNQDTRNLTQSEQQNGQEKHPFQPYCNHPQQQNLVCIKVHKAASTTMAAILERYGWRNNLTLAVPPDRLYGPHILSSSAKFKRHMLRDSNGTFNMITNHVRYNREEMDIVVPNATYMAIIRHPVKHFESGFAYFNVEKVVAKNSTKGEDPITVFMKNPEYFWNKKFYFWFQMKNGQMFDLGVDHEDQTGPTVFEAIQKFDEEFDLIMIADYFDESLILLRKHLCLAWNDIVYIKDNFRASDKKTPIAEEVRRQIEIWNWADMELYNHFNRTFWQKILDYGAEFDKDLQHFRSLLTETRKQCTENDIKRKPGDGHGVMRYVLRQNASEFCKDLLSGDVEYTRMFRERQTKSIG
ncbi:galactosylceramide sulfotransferase-like [Amphiura filiformis]|uniref:galactosylceramide sulfotransferase-like n=1 Tax=Amphiura filiformis TaxID=82378 RepID=UPI003B20F8E2